MNNAFVWATRFACVALMVASGSLWIAVTGLEAEDLRLGKQPPQWGRDVHVIFAASVLATAVTTIAGSTKRSNLSSRDFEQV